MSGAEVIARRFEVIGPHGRGNMGEVFRARDLRGDLPGAMAKAESLGLPYESPLTPPPGEGPRHPVR